jgi:hypothetical protein
LGGGEQSPGLDFLFLFYQEKRKNDYKIKFLPTLFPLNNPKKIPLGQTFKTPL